MEGRDRLELVLTPAALAAGAAALRRFDPVADLSTEYLPLILDAMLEAA